TIEGRKLHATQKPEALLYRILLACTDPGDVVLDPFFGSGTTGAVAKKLGRHYIGIERDTGYVEAARVRIAAIATPDGDPAVLGKIPAGRSAPRIPFAAVLENGLLLPGQALYFDGERAQCATVLADGSLRAADGERGSIHQMGARAAHQPSCNGWQYWYYETEAGDLRPIDELRQRLRQESE
ncbi:MAG: site-specific DNA-methyltransferase, partial [Anaerolineae bacterium]|nr:site-specific DNA-methyltransferase [Anaerolineae bacterium]